MSQLVDYNIVSNISRIKWSNLTKHLIEND